MVIAELHEFLSLRDIAERTGYSITWVRRVMIEQGLTFHVYHGRTFIDPATVERLLPLLPPRDRQ